MTFDSSNGYVYVNNFGSGNVTVINGATNRVVVPSITVGTEDQFGSLDPVNDTLFMSSYTGNNVTVISAATNKVVVSSIAAGSGPRALGFDTLNGYKYVADWAGSTVTVINAATGEDVGAAIPTGTYPFGIAVDTTNGYVYVPNQDSDNVTVIAPSYVIGSGSSGGSGSSASILGLSGAGADVVVALLVVWGVGGTVAAVVLSRKHRAPGELHPASPQLPPPHPLVLPSRTGPRTFPVGKGLGRVTLRAERERASPAQARVSPVAVLGPEPSRFCRVYPDGTSRRREGVGYVPPRTGVDRVWPVPGLAGRGKLQ